MSFKNVTAQYDDEQFDFELEGVDGEIGIKSGFGLTSHRDLSDDEIEALNYGDSETREWLRALWDGT